jgi:hypothetical protein
MRLEWGWSGWCKKKRALPPGTKKRLAITTTKKSTSVQKKRAIHAKNNPECVDRSHSHTKNIANTTIAKTTIAK